MMDDQVEALEDGELNSSSDDGYTPLERPATTSNTENLRLVAGVDMSKKMAVDDGQMPSALDTEGDSQLDSSDSSTESSDDCLKKLCTDDTSTQQRKRRKTVPRTVMLRVHGGADAEANIKRSRFKKYNVWTEALQEEALAENMRGCDVAQKTFMDRNVESYDFSLKYSLNGVNTLKRRLSNSTDDFSDNEIHPSAKRARGSTSKERQRHRPRYYRRSSSSTSSSGKYRKARYIPDLEDISSRDPLDIAHEMAINLKEEKDGLFIRIITVLGLELPIKIYKETQRIEEAGGLMIQNGSRRRTSGGVFLNILKNHDNLNSEDKKLIFDEDRRNDNKWHKDAKTIARDRKVEELKKRLSEQEKDLPALSTRKDILLIGSDLSIENQGNLSNPPPSPVGQEQSPEYKPIEINDVNVEKYVDTECPSTSSAVLVALSTSLSPSKKLVSYSDDFLDINCGDMDF